jgi:hypothetical protein
MTPGIAGGAAHIVLKQTTYESLESQSRFAGLVVGLV